VLEAAAWAGLAAMTLILGAWAGASFDASPLRTGLVMGFGAGALLVMVLDTMAPEAEREAGPASGLVAVAGFAFAFLLGAAA